MKYDNCLGYDLEGKYGLVVKIILSRGKWIVNFTTL